MEPMTLRDAMYVPEIKKKLVSIYTIDDRGYGVYVLNGKVHVFPKGSVPFSSFSIGVICGKLYKLIFQPNHALVHNSSKNYLCELWHKRMAHLHYPALQMLREMTTGMLEFNTESSGVCRGCTLGKYTKTAFPSSDSRSEG